MALARLTRVVVLLLLACHAPKLLYGEDEVDPLLHYMASDPHGDQDVFYQLSAQEMESFTDDRPALGVDELLE
eukprot:COSAG05_NODE_14238_length_403_cov_1.161184_1_plen_72_part_01